MGLLAAAPSAKADIVYTSTNILLTSSPFPGTVTGIDLNGDGINDFSFRHWIQTNLWYSFKSFEYAFLGPGGRGIVLGPLASGSEIGPGNNFGQGGLLKGFVLSNGTGHCYGAWAVYPTIPCRGFDSKGFLGLEFSISGETHYGWVEVSLVNPLVAAGKPSLYLGDTVIGYAYETNPNEPIRAGQTSEGPEPGTLGLLALGSLGLGHWRRRKAVVSRR